MTKAYFKFPPKRVSYLPRMVSRRFQAPSHGHTSEYKSGEKGDDSPDDDKRSEDDLLKEIDKRIQAGLATRATAVELEKISKDLLEQFKGIPLPNLRAMADDKTGVMVQLAKQGLEIQRLETQMAQRAEPKDMSIRGQIKAWMESKPKELGGTRSVMDVIKDIRGGVKASLPDLELRVASPMTPATVNAGASPYIGRTEVEAGINDFIRIQPTFWDFLTKGRTNAENYIWINKTNPLGAAAFIGPGEPKPGVSFELVAENSHAKKVADSAKAATELLEDIDGMATFIEQELRYQVMIKVNATLIANSPGSTTVPAGVRNYATTYTNTDIHVNSGVASFADAIRAVIGQLRAGFLTGTIDVFINPVDAANMDIAKATDSGVYLLPPFVTGNGMTVSGVRIIEEHSVAPGFILAGYFRFFRILIYKDFIVRWGWENDDFTRNLVTAIGEMRLHQFFNSIYTGAFVYDSFANIIAAISPVGP